jgi:DNA-binding CsgD family transcriptional regulator
MGYNRIFVLQAATILLMAALIGYGVLKLPSASTATPVSTNFSANSGAKTLALTLFLFYLANGFAGVQLSPGVPAQNINQGFWQLHFLVVFGCPLFGIFLDRRRGGAKQAMLVCSVLLILATTLNALNDSPLLHMILLSLGSLAQFAVLITATVAVAGLGTSMAWYGVAFLFPVLLRLVTHFAYTASMNIPALGGGASVLLATATAVGFHFAVRRMPDGEDAEAKAEIPPEVSPVVPPVVPPEKGVDHFEEFFRLHNLTPRECEVLRLLATGGSNLEIALRLDLSESTVKKHVRNIMTKAEVTNRNSLLVKVFSEK